MEPTDRPEAVTDLRLSIELPQTLASSPIARGIVGAAVSAVRPGGDTDVIELLVSELVSNAVIHGRSPVSVVLTVVQDGTSLLEVSDQGSGWADADTRAELRIGGHGLQLVDALAASWGCTANDGPGKTVWAEAPPVLP